MKAELMGAAGLIAVWAPFIIWSFVAKGEAVKKWKVLVYENQEAGMYRPYEKGDRLLFVDEFTFESDTASVTTIAEDMWVVGNKMGADASGKWFPNSRRSMCVGDVVSIEAESQVTWLTVCSLGYGEIDPPELVQA